MLNRKKDNGGKLSSRMMIMDVLGYVDGMTKATGLPS